MSSYTYIGQDFPVKDAVAKITGQARYTEDLTLPGMLHGAVLMSPHPHARIVDVDTTEAENLPGVRCVLCRKNTPQSRYNSSRRFVGHAVKADEQIFPEVVRYAGDRVAAVAADTQDIADKALKLIKVTYDVLPFVLDTDSALKADAPAIHEGGNVIGEIGKDVGKLEEGLAAADVVLEREFTTPRVNPFALEPHGTLANWDGRRLTLWTTSQNIFAFRLILSELLELPMNRIHLVRPTMGGAFGGKLEMVQEPVAALLAMRCGKPVRLIYSRKQCFTSTRCRHAAKVRIRLGAKNDGTLTALEYEEILDGGAYAGSSVNVMGAQSGKAFILYNVPHMRFRGKAVYTNTVIAGAMRGYGTQQIMTPLEMAMDELAEQLGVDRVAMRLKNLHQPYGPSPFGHGTVGNCRVADCVREGAALLEWDKPLPNANGDVVYGRGFACGVHGNSLAPITIDCSTTSVKMVEDGGLIVFCGNHDLGQGTVTMMAQIMAEVLGVHPDNMEFIEADTDVTSFDLGTFASRCTWVGGRSAKIAAEKLAAVIREEAAKMLRVDSEELELKDGLVRHRTDPHYTATLGQVAVYAQQVSRRGDLLVTGEYSSPGNVGSYAAHFAEVAVNRATGAVRVNRFVAAHDVGRALNPMNLEGQVHGGVHMGLGWALSERLEYDPTTGQMKKPLAGSYHLYKAADMPDITCRFVDGNESPGPYGAKSVGEIATVPAGAAVMNAVCNALGTRFYALPYTAKEE